MVQLTRRYYERLGRATAGWAILELGLDFVVAITFQTMGGESKQYPEIPRSLDKKIGYIKFAAKLADAAQWKDRLLEMAASISELRDRRHTLIHGVALVVMSADKAKVTRVRYTKLAHYSEEHDVSAEDISTFTKATAEATGKHLKLIAELIDDFKTKNADKPIGKRLGALLG
jgi:hypothetical protein